MCLSPGCRTALLSAEVPGRWSSASSLPVSSAESLACELSPESTSEGCGDISAFSMTSSGEWNCAEAPCLTTSCCSRFARVTLALAKKSRAESRSSLFATSAACSSRASLSQAFEVLVQCLEAWMTFNRTASQRELLLHVLLHAQTNMQSWWMKHDESWTHVPFLLLALLHVASKRAIVLHQWWWEHCPYNGSFKTSSCMPMLLLVDF